LSDAGAVEAVVEAVRDEFAPDPRMAVFDVDVRVRGDVVVLAGATSEALAAEALHQRVAALGAWARVVDEVVRLPEADPDERVHGLVTAAVAPLLAGPDIRTTQISQAVLGTRLLLLRREGRWFQCRGADRYVGWIHAGYLALVEETRARAWETGTEGDLWISLGGELMDIHGEVLARLPWGARVVREGPDAVRLPDGRRGRPSGELVPAAMRPITFPPDGRAVCETAARWMGVPYQWGGVTWGGVDCSGFVQVVFRLHGIALPRDSDQQSRVGEHAEPGEDFADLRAGDLLFFAEAGGPVTHVAISTGGSGILHSSLGNGGVARNDLAGRRRFERELRLNFVRARRVLPPDA
jgi:gamma-D-glutamyl-L-lysine dipeptidyl-peptidase